MMLEVVRGKPYLQRFLLGTALNNLGSGLTMSLLLIYLHEVRGIPTTVAGLVAAWIAAAALVFGPIWGSLIDRFGPKPVLLGGLGILCVGTASLLFVHHAPSAFAAATLLAMGQTSTWPAVHTTLARMVPQEQRQTVMGLNFMLLNLGLGLGGLIGATIVDIEDAGTFELLYGLDAFTYALVALIVLSIPTREYAAMLDSGVLADPGLDDSGLANSGLDDPGLDDHGTRESGSYADVLRDRRALRLTAFMLVLLTAGYGSMDSGIPLYIRLVLGLDVSVIGVLFFFNTVVIVVCQATVLRRIDGRSRVKVLAGVAMLWSGLWLAILLSAHLPLSMAAACITAGACVFALGECLFSPVASALLNDLAPEHLRGRYNSLGSIQWAVAGTVGPALAGFMIGRGWGQAWAATLAAACLLCPLLLPALSRQLTPRENGVGVPVR